MNASHFPVRTRLRHEVPGWVEDGAVFFLTVCAHRRGWNSLATAEVVPRILEAVRCRRRLGQWWPILLVVMPDHLHLLASWPSEKSMARTMTDWKRWLAREAGISWQDGFFDHRLRSHESFLEKADYIRMNPVRAGLVREPEAWPYLWNEDALG